MYLNYNLDLDEQSKSVQHTTSVKGLGFPLRLFSAGHFFCGEKYYTEREGYDSLLLLATVSGQGTIRLGDHDYPLRPMDSILIDCNRYHLYKTSGEQNWEFWWAHFGGSCADEYYNAACGDGVALISHNNNCIADSASDIFNISKRGEALADIRICLKLTEALTEMVTRKSCCFNDNAHNSRSDNMGKALMCIHANFADKINIDYIAQELHMSKFHFARTFKEYMGISPYEYIIGYRIRQAKELLVGGCDSIGDIAEKSGFSDVNNFIRSFKRYTGITPFKFRQNKFM